MKKALKELVLFYLVVIAVLEVSGYAVTKFGYMSGAMSKFVSESGFYAVALFMPMLFGWICFGAAPLLIRKCTNCGSKNIRLGWPRTGFVCDDCNQVHQLSLPRDRNMLILLFDVPFLLLGPCLSLGSILAGQAMSAEIIHTGIVFSTYIPFMITVFLYIACIDSPSLGDHPNLGIALLLLLISALGVGLLVYAQILIAIFRMLGFPI